MTGNKRAWGALLLMGLLARTYAQTPMSVTSPSANVRLPSVDLLFPHFSGSLDNLSALDPLITYGGELTVRADKLQGNVLRQQYLATGNVHIHEADTTLTASSLQFDGPKNIGVAQKALLTQKPFTLRAQQITIAPAQITALDGIFTTASPGTKPDLEARVGDLSLFPERHNGILHDVSLYLLDTRILTLRRVSFTLGRGTGSERRQVVVPSVGMGARTGPYVTFGGGLPRPFYTRYHLLLSLRQPPQLRLASRQDLLPFHGAKEPAAPSLVAAHDYLGALRKLATAPTGPLPENDPLLFHSYLPEPPNIRPLDDPPIPGLSLNEDLTTRNEASGRRKDNLYVSSLPEISLSGSLPLSHVPSSPPVGDAAAFRTYRRHLVLIANASVAYGYFEEQPEHLHASRQRDSVGLTTSPLLIAPNTLFQPRIQITINHYSGRRSGYRFVQASAEINHYFTPYSVLGVNLLGANTSGDSPFNFDVLDTSRELDVRLQLGNRKLAVAGQLRYDLAHGGIFDYELAVAPGLNGLTPVFSYNFRNRSFGFGVEIPGLNL